MGFAATVLILIAPAVVITLILGYFARNWSKWRTALVAACPAPIALLAFSVPIYIDPANTPPEKCGTDACGMAMAAAIFIGIGAVLCLVLGLGASWLVQSWWRR